MARKMRTNDKYLLRPFQLRYRKNVKFCLVVLALIISRCSIVIASTSSSGGGGANPYKVLGVPKKTPQEDIKKRYRKLCLKYHPDKNVGSDVEERKRCEDAFKSIQHAYSLIGDEESRRQYDSTSSLLNRPNPFTGFTGGPGGPSQNPFAGSPFDAYQAGAGRYGARRPAFYVNRVDISHLFEPRRTGFPNFPGQSNLVNPDDPKSIFVEKVTVPLEELYSGLDRKELFVSDGVLSRYKAAFRGGIAGPIALNGLMAAIPMLLRRSWPLPVLCFVAAFHFGLPRPTRLYYSASIKKGWKGGTKLKFFDAQSGMEVVFILKEAQHSRFAREGNNLRTKVTIGKSKARKGCTVLIDPLAANELPIMVKLRAGEIKHDKQVVTVKGKGWPKKSGGIKGDLLVTVRVVSDAKASKIRKMTMERREKAHG